MFPGAAVASITALSSLVGGDKIYAGKHDALSCRMILPDRYKGSSIKRVLGWNARRSGICASCWKFLLHIHMG